jgi:L-ascorbate metabolism protein UlaG (beta-lactamase superfamily)
VTRLFFYGHACFALEEGNAKVLIDPFFKGNPHLSTTPELKPSLILVTHAHYDHLGDAIEIARKTGSALIGQPELVEHCKKNGAENIVKLHYGGTVDFDFGSVKMVPAWHTSSIGEERLYAGNPCGYVINFFEKTYYHAGDTCLFGDMKIIAESTPIDIALLPIGGRFTMGVSDAIIAVNLLNPKIVIPMHYGTFDVHLKDPTEFKKRVESETRARCVVMEPGTFCEVPELLRI